jgi:hypothetical protein
MSNLLFHRDYSALGDWIMAMTVIKEINLAYPDIQVDINILDKKGNPHPPIIRSVIENFDIRYNEQVEYKNPAREGDYKYRTGHVIYSYDDKLNYISSMINNVRLKTGLNLDFQYYQLALAKKEKKIEVPKNYVLMQSQGKLPDKMNKDWGYDNFDKLSRSLFKHFNIVQIGAKDDPELLAACKIYLDCDIPQINYLMQHCKFYIGIADGLSVFADVHDLKSYIIYKNPQDGINDPKRNYYNTQTQIIDKNDAYVYNLIKDKEL